MTAQDIVLRWIDTKSKSADGYFASYDLESEVPVYGRLAHQKVHTASTYARTFRKIRESNALKRFGLKLEEITHKDNKGIKGWKIIKDS